jgi:hypothetical protein
MIDVFWSKKLLGSDNNSANPVTLKSTEMPNYYQPKREARDKISGVGGTLAISASA